MYRVDPIDINMLHTTHGPSDPLTGSSRNRTAYQVAEEFEDLLNEQEADGWHLVTVHMNSGMDRPVAVFHKENT